MGWNLVCHTKFKGFFSLAVRGEGWYMGGGVYSWTKSLSMTARPPFPAPLVRTRCPVLWAGRRNPTQTAISMHSSQRIVSSIHLWAILVRIKSMKHLIKQGNILEIGLLDAKWLFLEIFMFHNLNNFSFRSTKMWYSEVITGEKRGMPRNDT